MLAKIKKFFKENEADIILVFAVILISLISFGAGYLLACSKEKITGSNINEKSMIVENVPIEKLEVESENKKEENLVTENIKDKNESGEIKDKNEKKEQKDEDVQEKTEIVASKNSDVYHYVWCPGANQIKEENKIYFNSTKDAEKAGLRPAKNCKELQK